MLCPPLYFRHLKGLVWLLSNMLKTPHGLIFRDQSAFQEPRSQFYQIEVTNCLRRAPTKFRANRNRERGGRDVAKQ